MSTSSEPAYTGPYSKAREWDADKPCPVCGNKVIGHIWDIQEGGFLECTVCSWQEGL